MSSCGRRGQIRLGLVEECWEGRRDTFRVRSPTPATFAIVVVSAAVVASQLLRRAHVANLGAHAALETAITVCAIVTGGLLVADLKRGHRLRELLLALALLALMLTDFAYSTAPAVAGIRGVESSDGARLFGTLIVALALAAAAAARPNTTVDFRRGAVRFAVAVGAGVLALGPPLAHVIGASTRATAADSGVGGAAYPVALIVYATSTAILAAAAVTFLADHRREQHRSVLLAGASLLLAAANVQYRATPTVATSWVTPRDGLRVAAYALLLVAAYLRHVQLRRAEAYAAICSERERIAADLHDGLAQDLACIAAQGQRLACQLGPQHPLMVASRQALAASRGVIAELTACTAPSTEAALRLIADELAHRFEIEVNVRIEAEPPLNAEHELEPSQREHLIRIAREAIVNAALHGTARHVDVVLLRRVDALLMRVSDDGHGITEGQRPGFGVRTMRARAASLGGQLQTRARAGGGTELEVLVG